MRNSDQPTAIKINSQSRFRGLEYSKSIHGQKEQHGSGTTTSFIVYYRLTPGSPPITQGYTVISMRRMGTTNLQLASAHLQNLEPSRIRDPLRLDILQIDGVVAIAASWHWFPPSRPSSTAGSIRYHLHSHAVFRNFV